MSPMSTGSTRVTEATTTVTLIRHGESAANSEGRVGGHGPTPLTALGQRQAQAMSRAVARDIAPAALVSSDLVRARQTAEPLAEATGLDITFDPRWRERTLGVMDDLRFEQCAERYPEHWRQLRARDPSACPPGGEPLDALYARVSTALDELVTRHAGEHVVVVSHGLAIFHAFAHICGLGSPGQGLKVFLLVDNCSLSTFRYRGGHWGIKAINDCTHLREAGK